MTMAKAPAAAPAATPIPAPAAASAAAAPAPAVAEVQEDPFAAAFTLMAKNEENDLAAAAAAATAVPEKPAEKPAAAADAKPAEGEEAKPADGEEPKPAEGEEAKPAEGEEPKPAAAAKPAESASDEVLARLAKLVNNAPAEEKPAPQERPAPQPAPELYSTEEKQLLDTYEKDWPDVARAEMLKRRGEYQQLVAHVFGEIAKEIQPIIEVVRTLSERTHLADLTQAAPDYEQLRENVIEWVKTQPAYLRTAYEHVISQGTAEEVSDLISRYKGASGQPVANSKAPAVSAPVKPETELPPAAKKAVASLAPVSSKRSAVVQQADPSDFEGAFAAFAKEQT